MALEEYKEIFIEINIEKSDEAIKMANIALNENALMTAFNRIYYSIFYTVSALAEKQGFKTSKHNTMIGWFHKKYFYESKTFNKDIFDTYNNAFQYRQKGDYDRAYKLDKDEAIKLLAEAKIFIETVRKEIFKDRQGKNNTNFKPE